MSASSNPLDPPSNAVAAHTPAKAPRRIPILPPGHPTRIYTNSAICLHPTTSGIFPPITSFSNGLPSPPGPISRRNFPNIGSVINTEPAPTASLTTNTAGLTTSTRPMLRNLPRIDTTKATSSSSSSSGGEGVTPVVSSSSTTSAAKVPQGPAKCRWYCIIPNPVRVMMCRDCETFWSAEESWKCSLCGATFCKGCVDGEKARRH